MSESDFTIEESKESTMSDAVYLATMFQETGERKKDGAMRVCVRCLKMKPDRCHHCSVCNKCVVLMDHHCPWLINCIGMMNYKFFFLTVLYALVCLYIFCLTYAFKWYSLVTEPNDRIFEMIFWVKLISTVSFFLGVFLTALLTGFFVFHNVMMVRNYTTLEHFEKRR